MDNNIRKSIVSIDPGEKHIGVFIYHYHESIKEIKVIRYDFTQFDSKLDYTDITNITNYLDNNLQETNEVTFIVENFINYTHKTSMKDFKKNHTSEVIGQLKQYFNNYYPESKQIYQNASMAKIWDDERLIRLGILNKSGTKTMMHYDIIKRHTKDALRHLVAYINKNLYDKSITKFNFFFGKIK